MRRFSMGFAILLLLIGFASARANAAEEAEFIEALKSAETAYNNANLEKREKEKREFVSLLTKSIDADQRIVRRRATYLLNVYFGNDPETLEQLVALLQPPVLSELGAAGQINAMHLVASAGDEAWTSQLLREASDRTQQIADDPPPQWGSERANYFQELRDRLAMLNDLSPVAWAFGTVQEHDAETTSFTDIDVFVCEDSRENASLVNQARQLAELLARRDFGRVRLRVWPSDAKIPLSELKSHSTIVFDAKHPEEKEVGRVKEAFSEIGEMPPWREQPNRGEASGWYLSLFICP